ncbi:MAG TPA: DegT/DnrJ/EryC1/StrS family aminotransferase [Vicinamibacterales bacterium]|nr:DegT/DnrJ/EryC1/StrS family aminotransferase [Vicinamibacterales bacterium]
MLTEIPLTRPQFDDAEARAVAEVLASGWVSQGPKVASFEESFAARVGARYGVATTSCTTALHLALLLAGVGPGDEVICPSYSFIATANAIRYAGATPVFADIEPDTWNLDADDALRRVTPRTRAVLPVHQVGLAADLDRFAAFAARGIAIVEDAACGIGALYKGRPVGSSGNLSCFSFHPRKTISVGEGGMLMTDDPDIAARARRLRSHGASISDHARHQTGGLVAEEYREIGYNYRMTDVQAAIGLMQLTKLDAFLAGRRAIARRYDEAFAALPAIQTPARPQYAEHAYQSYAVCLTPQSRIDRDSLMRGLVDAGVSCRRGIAPAHLEPVYRDSGGRCPLPVTERVAAQSVFLPIFPALARDDQQRVIDAVCRLVA